MERKLEKYFSWLGYICITEALADYLYDYNPRIISDGGKWLSRRQSDFMIIVVLWFSV